MSMVGSKVMFEAWDDETGLELRHVGVVEAEFTEPPQEDRYQRLNYRVRLNNGQVHTPYASECTPV